MKKSLSVCFATVVFISWAGIGFSQQGQSKGTQKPKVSQKLWQKVQEKGVVSVIVQLVVPWQPEGKLSKSEIMAQRKAITNAQKKLLAELAGTKYKVRRQFQTARGISLDVDAHALAILENSTLVLGVTENLVGRISLSRSVPLVGVGQGSTGSFDGTGFAVAILDTGVDRNHPFLTGKVVDESCFSSRGSCPNGGQIEFGDDAARPCTYSADCVHGTHVAGIAAGVGADFSGVAKGAKIVAVQVFSNVGGSAIWEVDDLIAALGHVISVKDNIPIAAVNMSLGILGIRYPDQEACDKVSPLLKENIDNLRSVGIATVIAAGNDGFTDGLSFPGCISSVVSVGATAIQ